MILTLTRADAELDAWRANGAPISDDTAQTIASWWHSPANPDLTRFSHGRPVPLDALRDAVNVEIADVADQPEREELDALIGWIDRQTPPDWPGFEPTPTTARDVVALVGAHDWDGNPYTRAVPPGYVTVLRGRYGDGFDLDGPHVWACPRCGDLLFHEGGCRTTGVIQGHYAAAHGHTPALLP